MKNRFSRAANIINTQSSSGSKLANAHGLTRDYFDDDDDDTPGTSSLVAALPDDPDYDPLDAYICRSGIQEQIVKDNSVKTGPLPEVLSKYDDYDEEVRKIGKSVENSSASELADLDDEDGDKKKLIEPLTAVDHNKIVYAPFQKCFYRESSDLASMSPDEVSSYREELEIHVPIEKDIAKPLKTFKQAGFESQLLKEIEKTGYTAPTAIQAQTIPLALSGLDVIGLAKTGSGKTLAYLWPIIVHIMHQPQMQLGEGPIALVLAPTRELAGQIFTEAKKFTKVYNIRAAVIYGGAGKFEMSRSLKESPELVIATPGRLIEMIKNKSTNLARCTIAVLDEADRMFEMGFEYQMRSIVQHIRPHDRQILMFSATMKRKIEGFAREILNKDSVRVVIGSIGQANPDIQQIVHILPSDQLKYQWLLSNIEEFVAEGKVLIFVLSKVNTEELSKNLRDYFVSRFLSVNVDCLHGDKDQAERSLVMSRFKHSTLYHTAAGGASNSTKNSNEISILIATDIASRGLDVKDIRTVINYDIAKNIDTYVHRIGRTGRMGQEGITPGTAYTLLTNKDGSFAVDLVHNLTLSSQPVTPELRRLAENDPKWKRHNQHGRNHNGGYSSGGAGGGIGFVSAGGVTSGSNPSVYGAGVSAVGVAPRAATSSMLAQTSREHGHGQEIQYSTGVLKAYDRSAYNAGTSNVGYNSSSSGFRNQPQNFAGMSAGGRGKHLTQPAWMTNAYSSHSATSGGEASALEPNKKKSRFSEAILPGFVKSSTTILGTVTPSFPQPSPVVQPAEVNAPTAVSDHTDTATSEPAVRARKSRWDT